MDDHNKPYTVRVAYDPMFDLPKYNGTMYTPPTPTKKTITLADVEDTTEWIPISPPVGSDYVRGLIRGHACAGKLKNPITVTTQDDRPFCVEAGTKVLLYDMKEIVGIGGLNDNVTDAYATIGPPTPDACPIAPGKVAKGGRRGRSKGTVRQKLGRIRRRMGTRGKKQ